MGERIKRFIMDAWKQLFEYVKITEGLISEERSFHGKSAIRLKDLQTLGKKIGVDMNPNGGTARTKYGFNPTIWKPWHQDIGVALATASTDDKRYVQSGNHQGGTIHKGTYDGRVSNVAAPIRPHDNDKIGSTMDRYDVLMSAEIEDRVNSKGKLTQDGVLTRITWSPSIGTADERRARLEALASGKPAPHLNRRAQGEIPDTREPSHLRRAEPVSRVGQFVRPPKEMDPVADPPPRKEVPRSDFKRRSADISKDFYGDKEFNGFTGEPDNLKTRRR